MIYIYMYIYHHLKIAIHDILKRVIYILEQQAQVKLNIREDVLFQVILMVCKKPL